MFGNSDDIRKETKKETNNEPCYGGFGGRFSYELLKSKNRNIRLTEIIRKIVTVLVSCIFFGSLGVLAGLMIFNVVQGDFIPSVPVKESKVDSTAKNENAINITDSLTELAFFSGGAEMVSVTKEYSERYRIPMGVLVRDISSDSAGYAAGVRDGDIIVTVNGNAVLGESEIFSLADGYKTGDSIQVRVFRDGEHHDFTVEIE